jgi:hypothetical protein
VCFSFLSVYRCPARYGSGQGSVADTLTQRSGWMKKTRFLLADDHPLGPSVARLSLIGRTSGRGGGSRREGPHQGGFSLELLPVWKSRKVFSCPPHNFHLCLRVQAGLPRVAGSAPEPASLTSRRGLSPLLESSRRGRAPFGTPRRGCCHASRLRTLVSLAVSTVSSRTLVNNAD